MPTNLTPGTCVKCWSANSPNPPQPITPNRMRSSSMHSSRIDELSGLGERAQGRLGDLGRLQIVVVVEVVQRLVEPAVGHAEVELGGGAVGGAGGGLIELAIEPGEGAGGGHQGDGGVGDPLLDILAFEDGFAMLDQGALDRPGEAGDAAAEGVGVRPE